MNEQIITFISEYIHSYEDYKNTIADESLLADLTKIYHELLDIAEDNSTDYENFLKVCQKRDVAKRFRTELDKIKSNS